MAVEIRQVQDKSELKRFVQFGNELYKKNPYHVPVLIDDELGTLDKDRNPAFEFCEAAYFLAYRNGRIVGRIAGIINHRANETWNQSNARFGFLDFINDNAVVDALFEVVEKQGNGNAAGAYGFYRYGQRGDAYRGLRPIGDNEYYL